jgi:hypothetical protein
MDLALGTERLVQRFVPRQDLAVDRDRRSLGEPALERREALEELGQELAHVGSRDLERLRAARESSQPGREDDARQRYCALSSSSSSFGGEIGSSVISTPAARCTAFATAASGGTIGVSPTPRTP